MFIRRKTINKTGQYLLRVSAVLFGAAALGVAFRYYRRIKNYPEIPAQTRIGDLIDRPVAPLT